MRWLDRFSFYAKSLFQKRKLDTQLSEEIREHVELATEANVANGMSPKEARYAAMREFGGVEQIKEQTRDERGWVWLEQFWQDLRYAVRSLVRSPSFTITAVLTLALGIGVNAGLFSLYNMIALRTLPVEDPDSLVHVAGHNSQGSSVKGFSFAEYQGYREGTRALDGVLAATQKAWAFQREGESLPEIDFSGRGINMAAVALVSENYFEVLGVAVNFGRGFLPEEVRAGTPVIVLSHAFWKAQLLGDPNVIGTSLRFERRLYTIIGIAPARFTGHSFDAPAGWVPYTMLSNRPDDFVGASPRVLSLVGRLRSGVTEAQAKADLETIAAKWTADFPEESAKVSIHLKSGMRFNESGPNPKGLIALGALFFGFGLVLVIACTNVANLLFARGVSRQTEIGVRLALGASRGRIIRQLLTENVLLCVLGALMGLGLGVMTLKLILTTVMPQFMSPALVLVLSPMPDLRVLGFTALLALVATLSAGFLPALHAVRGNFRSALHNEGTAFGRRLTPARLRQVLVIVQVAVCLMLLSCAGVLVRNVFEMKKTDRGFDANKVFPVRLTPNTAISDRSAAMQQGLKVVRAIPGVAGVGLVNPPPLEVPNGVSTRIQAVGTASGGTEQEVPTNFIAGGFLDALGIPLRGGRNFRELEHQSSARVVMVSESLARQLWPDQDAVGNTLAVSEEPWKWGSSDRAAVQGIFRECEVIGVVADAKLQIGDDKRYLLYLPYPFDIPMYASTYIRLRSNTAAARAGIVQASKDGGVGLQFSRSLLSLIEQQELGLYGFAVLSCALGGLALAMASVGLYGLMQFSVNQRVREIGIRMALGASAEKVVRLFVRQSMRLVVIGLGLGLIGAGLFALLLEKVLFGFDGVLDLMAFGAVTLLFGAIALFACWLPARRATKVDPMVALRTE